MLLPWTHAGPSIAAAFLASLVEFIEALTVVLAVGAVRGWRDALAGAGAAMLALMVLIVVLGSALTRIPLGVVQIVVGTLLLLFGMRWLRKAILRAAGVIPLHSESTAYAEQTQALRRLGAKAAGLDKIAFAAAFKITLLEGAEVVFIVIAVGSDGSGLLWPASLGALAALVVVALLGLVVHRPLSRVPENPLKFVVGVLLAAFGCFWVGEGFGFRWPGDDWAIPGLIVAFLVIALCCIPQCRRLAADAAP